MWIFIKYVKEIVEGKPFKLIEAVAEKIARSILEQFAKVNSVVR